MSVGPGSSTKCGEITSAVVIITLSPEGRAAHSGMGVAIFVAFGISVCCDSLLLDQG